MHAKYRFDRERYKQSKSKKLTKAILKEDEDIIKNPQNFCLEWFISKSGYYVMRDTSHQLTWPWYIDQDLVHLK